MIIRNIEVNDSKKMLKMLKALDKETKYMMLEEDERSSDIGLIENMIFQATNNKNLLLVAVENNEIIGFLSAQKGYFNKIKHTAYIVVGIREEHRNKGIGKELFRSLDIWTKKEKIMRLELTVVCENIIAKNLYEKNGFEIEGIKKKSLLIDGIYMDEYYMAKVYQK